MISLQLSHNLRTLDGTYIPNVYGLCESFIRNARCTKIFTKWVLQTDVEPHMRLHVSLIVKLFKTNRQKYPSSVEPSPEHRRAPDTSETRSPRWAWVSGRISQRMHEDGEREKKKIRIQSSGGLTISIQIRPSGVSITVSIQISPVVGGSRFWLDGSFQSHRGSGAC
jgi:hypothetical protein